MMEIDLTEDEVITDVVVKEEYILDDNFSDSEASAVEEVEAEEEWQNESPATPEDTKDFLQFEITELTDLDTSQKRREKRLKCQVCDRKFQISKYYTHLESHTDEDKIHCEVCMKTFVSEVSMRKHMRTTHECDICGGIFEKRKDMTIHILEEHKGVKSKNIRRRDVKPFRCEKCGRFFSFECHYVQHISASVDCTRQLTCPLCNQECKTQSTLSNHIKSHSTDKPFVCTICDKSFKMKSHLETHVSVHMNRQVFCPYCPKAFKVQKAVELHIQNRHRGLPPNPNDPVICCTICKKIYKSLKDLKIHVRMHPKPKPFECELCGKGMSAASYMKKHMEAHLAPKELPMPPIKKEIL